MFETENFAVADGINYEYVYIKASDNSKATFLFLHGFPSSYYCWRNQIEYFSKQGYGCLAPNLMGYGKTYSPLDDDQYRTKSMVDHLLALMDHLNLNKAIVVGHDWGVRPATRFILHHPERALGLILFNVGYRPPAQLNLEQAIENTKKAFGYATMGYWEFFNADDAAQIIETNANRFLDLCFTDEPEIWKTDFSPVGAARQWVTSTEKTTGRASFITDRDFDVYREYASKNMQPKLNWYRSAIKNIDWNDEKDLDPTLKCPVLFIAGQRDYVCVPQLFAGQKKDIPDFESVALDTSHWTMEEKPDEVNKVVENWVEKKHL